MECGRERQPVFAPNELEGETRRPAQSGDMAFPYGGDGGFGGGFGGGGFGEGGGFGMPVHMMGGRGFGQQNFSQRYHAVPVAAADKTDTKVLEAGGKIMLPPSALRQLSQLEIAYPMLFEITNHSNGRKLHCGVLEFIANEGSVLMPHWMMQNLGVEHGDLVKVESATLPKGTYVKLRPQSKSFIDIANPKAVLENTLRSFSALTRGSTIRIHYNQRQYDIDVVDIRPRDHGAISIVDTDVNVDFDTPADYVEPVRQPMAAPKVETFKDQEMPEVEPELADGTVKAFSGAGARPNGKAVDGTAGMDIDSASTVSSTPKSALQWKLRFERFGGYQPDLAKKGGDDGTGNGFQAFKGGGQSLKAARGS